MTLATDFSAFVDEFKATRASTQAKPPAPRVPSPREYVYKPATTCSLCGDPSDQQVCARCAVFMGEHGL